MNAANRLEASYHTERCFDKLIKCFEQTVIVKRVILDDGKHAVVILSNGFSDIIPSEYVGKEFNFYGDVRVKNPYVDKTVSEEIKTALKRYRIADI